MKGMNMDDYNKYLKEEYGDLVINLVKHDTSFTGLPCYIEIHLGKKPKDKDMGTIAKDLSNYLYRLGLNFQSMPEYRGRGKNTTIRYFMTWKDIEPIQKNICKAFNKPVLKCHLPLEFNSLIIQNKSRGVYSKELD